MSTHNVRQNQLLKMRAASRFVLVGGALAILLVPAYTAVRAQGVTVPSWVENFGNLLLVTSTITADPTLTAPEAQGLGQKFELLFAMMNDKDPHNADNDTISVTTTPGTFAAPGAIGAAVRNMLPGAKVATLTNQLSIKYFFVPPRSCDGGSPRIQLFIDPGDGTPPHNAFGYIGHGGFGTGCVSNVGLRRHDG